MPSYFPRHTDQWKIEEPPAFRRFTLSLVGMAITTGVVLRLFRALVLSQGPVGNLLYLGATFAIGALILFGMVTLHLGNHTLRTWTWRAPAFAAIEAGAEMVTSALLIALGVERVGSTRAAWSDWLGLASTTLLWRAIAVAAFALVLSVIVQVGRYLLLQRENRLHTAEAVHDHMRPGGGGEGEAS